MRNKLWAAFVAIAIGFSGVAFAADGGKIFKSKCSACHGPTGGGTPMAPALKGNDFVKNGSMDEIKSVILNGREGSAKKYPKFPIGMPKQSLSDDEVKAVIDYIKSL